MGRAVISSLKMDTRWSFQDIFGLSRVLQHQFYTHGAFKSDNSENNNLIGLKNNIKSNTAILNMMILS